jgi:hypothetical protein
MGDWLPGAVEALRAFHEAGAKVLIFSARLSPYDPFTSRERHPAEVMNQVQAVRAKLDNAGLHFVDIWTLGGKPGGSVYIDDKAERYHGRPGSWKALRNKVLVRMKLEEPELPEFHQDVAKGET